MQGTGEALRPETVTNCASGPKPRVKMLPTAGLGEVVADSICNKSTDSQAEIGT